MAEIININKLKDGDTGRGYLFLTKIEEKVTAAGSVYCVLTLQDGNCSIQANKWSVAKEDLRLTENSIVGLKLNVGTYKGALSYKVEEAVLADPNKCPYKEADFRIGAPLDENKMYEGILKYVADTVNGEIKGTLAELTHNIYENNKEKLLYWSAAQGIHHNFYGGLLYHTYRMVKQAVMLSELYPSLNAELLVSATALHDIGKLKEIDTDAMGNSDYSIDGQLFGHSLIGIEMVDEECKNGEYDGEMVKCLKHCISSHHGNLEWGAITLPHIEEAAVLHYIDMIDSRVQQYENIEKDMEAGTISEKKVFGLENIKVYKPSFRGPLKIDY